MQKAEAVRWCPWCGWEGVAYVPVDCPRCDRATVGLGWRVGEHRAAYSYYSSLATVPKKDR